MKPLAVIVASFRLHFAMATSWSKCATTRCRRNANPVFDPESRRGSHSSPRVGETAVV